MLLQTRLSGHNTLLNRFRFKGLIEKGKQPLNSLIRSFITKGVRYLVANMLK